MHCMNMESLNMHPGEVDHAGTGRRALSFSRCHVRPERSGCRHLLSKAIIMMRPVAVCEAACMPCSIGTIEAPALEHHSCCRALSLRAAGRIGNRQVRRAVARRGLHRRQPLKNGRLITPRVTWPPFDAGLSMEICGTSPDGVQMFQYVHSTAYGVRPRTAIMTADVSRDHWSRS